MYSFKEREREVWDIGDAYPLLCSSSRLEAFHSEPLKETSIPVNTEAGSTVLVKSPKVSRKTDQINMIEDLSGAVHLSQDDDHLIIDKLLELPQVADHLHLQLCADLKTNIVI